MHTDDIFRFLNLLNYIPQMAFPAHDEEDVCDLWKAVTLESAPRELPTHARRLMAALPDDERRKNLCGILLADYLDPEYSPVPFFLREEEPTPEDVERALLEVQLHQYALETWHGLLASKKSKLSAHSLFLKV